MMGGRCLALLAVVAALLTLHSAHAYPVKAAKGQHGDILADAAAAGHHSASVVGELWSLGSDGDDEVQKAATNSGTELDAQRHAVLQKLKLASDFKRRAQLDGDAISYGLDQKLVSLPPCKCGKETGWAIVKKARAQVLAEEGEPASATDCPCGPSVVGAVTDVLEQKLQQLQMELGSKTAASLALRKALVAMRLPTMLSQDLVQELDSLDGLGDKPNATGAAGCADCDEQGSGEAGGGIHVTVNTNIPNGLQEEYEANMTSTQPYFNSYQYPASYLARPARTTVDEDGTGVHKHVNVVVNVNNNFYMQGPPAPAMQHCFPHCVHLFKAVPGEKTSTLHAAHPPPARDHAVHTRAHGTAAHVTQEQKQHAAKVQQKAHVLAEEGHKAAATGSGPGPAGNLKRGAAGAVSEQDKAKALASKIEAAAQQLRAAAGSAGAERRGAGRGGGEEGTGKNGEQWEEARRRLVDTALSLERIARQRAERLRRHMESEEEESSHAARKAPTQQLAMLGAGGGKAAGRSEGGEKQGARRQEPRGATPVESPIAPYLKLPVDEVEKSSKGHVPVPVVTDPAPKPDITGMLKHMGALGVSDQKARKDLSSYFDAAAAQHGGGAAVGERRRGRGGGREEEEEEERKGTRAGEDGAGLLQESDSSARSDLMSYFDKDLPAHPAARRAAGKRKGGAATAEKGILSAGNGALAEVSDSAARSDLFSYFDTLSARSARYTKAEEQRAAHGKLRGKRGSAARDDLTRYYDDLAKHSKMYTKEEESKRH